MAWYQRSERLAQRVPSRPSRYKGSRKRIDRIRLGQHWSAEIVIFFVGVVLMLLVGVPWLIRHN